MIYSDLFKDVTKFAKKLPTSDYQENGKHPIIDQGQKQIAGYTDIEEGLFSDVPAIIFGDHTRVIKYIDTPFFIGADGVKVIKSKEEQANYNYLYYLLSSVRIPNTGYNRHYKWLKEAHLIEHTKEEQEKIVVVLSTIDNILDLYSVQLNKLDELIKSRFVEMFGDPIINPFNWDELVIANVLRGKASNGFFAKRDEYCDNGNVSILGVTNIVNRMYSNCDNLPKTNANNTSIEKYRVQYGDMLFCRSSLVAEGIGKASIVPTNIPDNVLFECHVIRLPLDTNKVIPEYLQVLTTLDFFRNQVLASAKTATMTTIGQDGILKCNIILPPYKMQQEYLAYINQINKIKTIINQSIEKLETLKKSLMQEYFG